MRTIIRDKEVDIRFWREKVRLEQHLNRTLSFRPLSHLEKQSVHQGYNLKGMSIRTHCYISRIDNTKTGKDRFSLLAEGISTRNTIDTDNKYIGKQISLHRALMKLGFGKDAWETAGDILIKDTCNNLKS
jgi:hypothetical protein